MKTLSILFSTFFFASLTLASDPSVDFARDIKPILADKCYSCHGPDAVRREGGGEDGLRFDTEEGAFADLGGYQAIVRGDAEASELVSRITSGDPDIVMPPHDHPKSLSDTDIDLLTRWIQQGAKWSLHWSFNPLNLAVSREGEWIDRLIREKLKSQNTDLSEQAQDSILLRRIHFDLLGLPPTNADLQAFEDANPENRWAQTVDRLLESPHFGERMAIYWLDLVRYADTVGYHGDQDVSVSPYRDYVIDAFNQNLPFDQFTREQLAGDLLPDATDAQKIASGYNRLGMMSAEGGAQPKEYLTKYASDRVRTASTVWLGTTLGCAECHDHKFDPFTQQDFYQFASYFADIKERGLYAGANRDGQWGPSMDVPDDQLADLLAPLLDQQQKKSEQYNTTPISEAMTKWVEKLSQPSERWLSLKPDSVEALHGTKFEVKEDASVLASGAGSESNTYTLTFSVPKDSLAAVTGIRVEALPDDSLPAKGPGRAGNGNFVISEVRAAMVSEGQEPASIELTDAKASFEQADGNQNPYKGWKAVAAIDNDEKGKKWGWAVMPNFGVSHSWIASLKSAQAIPEDAHLVVTIEQNHDNPGHTLGRFRISLTDDAVDFDPRRAVPTEILAIIDKAAGDRSDDENIQLESHYRGIAPELESLRQEMSTLEKQIADLKSQHTRTTLVTVAVEPREMRVLPRGNWMDDSGPIVDPCPPHFLPQATVEGEAQTNRRQTRLDLANWIVAENNPLTARVFVNRLWKLFFGTGLSKVLDDIGSQGEYPSHPKLLDALAIEFIESGWDVKHMVRLIVNSETYRQSSAPRAELADIDPYNRLLARQSRFRLDAEMVRDNALAISGLLVQELGGRSVKPYQPAGLLRHLNFPTRTYKADSGESQYRRGVYTHWQRQFLHPAMKLFDAPAREECTAERPRSNTPLAALVMLNDPSYVEAARVYAERLLNEQQDEEKRIEQMIEQALTRKATEEEIAILSQLREQQFKYYSDSPEEAKALIDIGDRQPSPELDPVELASYVAVSRAVFNLHEFITRN